METIGLIWTHELAKNEKREKKDGLNATVIDLKLVWLSCIIVENC